MSDELQPLPADKIKAGPQATISLERVLVEFPPGCWDLPSNNVVMPDGRRLVDHRIDQIALMIAGTLRRLLDERQTPSGLLGPDGRALVAPPPSTTPDTLN